MMQGQGYNLGRVKFRIITHIFIAKSLKLCTANCNIGGRKDMFPQLHAVERQHFSEILAKDLAGARGTTAKVAFIPLLVLIKCQFTTPMGNLVLTMKIYGMPLTSSSRFGRALSTHEKG